MKEEISKVIENTAQATAQAAVFEFKRQNMLKDNTKTPFQKTEQLLYNYSGFKKAVIDKKRQIQEIKQNGTPQKSNSITTYSASSIDATRPYGEEEKISEAIEALENSIRTTEQFVMVLEDAINSLKEDPYFKIIEMKYIEKNTREDISLYFGVDASTISRNKNRLINSLQIRLFSDEVIHQIFS